MGTFMESLIVISDSIEQICRDAKLDRSPIGRWDPINGLSEEHLTQENEETQLIRFHRVTFITLILHRIIIRRLQTIA